MRVLFVGSPGFHTQDEPLFPLGLGYLVSAVRDADHKARAVHFIREEHMKKALPEFIKSYAPQIVGFNCNTFNRGTVRRGIAMVKALNPDIKVVVGGVHASYLYFQMLNDYKADYVAIGEGERTIVHLLNHLEDGEDLHGCKGIAFKNDGFVSITKPCDPIMELDDLPLPDYSFATDLMMSGMMGYTITSRGCPARCKFCSSGSFWGQNVRMHSVDRVICELEGLFTNFGVKRFHFHDNTFNINIPRVLNICKAIIDAKLNIEWGASCRVHPVSPEMIEAMVEAGCRHIAWGVESGSDKIMKWMDKRITKEQIKYAYDLCEPYSKKGLLGTGTFMMVGFPGESNETVKETIQFLNTLSMTDRPSCSVLYVLPGTHLWEDQKRVSESYWAISDEVLYSNCVTGIELELLYEWGKAIEAAGKRIPFDNNNHFWRGVIVGTIPVPRIPTP